MILILTFQNDVLYSHASFDIFPAIRIARVFRVRLGLRTDVAELALHYLLIIQIEMSTHM